MGPQFVPRCLAGVEGLFSKSFLSRWAVPLLVLWLVRAGFLLGLCLHPLAFLGCCSKRWIHETKSKLSELTAVSSPRSMASPPSLHPSSLPPVVFQLMPRVLVTRGGRNGEKYSSSIFSGVEFFAFLFLTKPNSRGSKQRAILFFLMSVFQSNLGLVFLVDEMAGGFIAFSVNSSYKHMCVCSDEHQYSKLLSNINFASQRLGLLWGPRMI